MKLTDEQIVILEKCAEQKSIAIVINYFKGKGYLFSAVEERPELDVDGDVVKPLFDNGYLQHIGNGTCALTESGRLVLSYEQGRD